MRRLFISILLAGAAASPALAQEAGDREHGRFQLDDNARAERREAREQRQQSRQDQRAAPVEQVRPEPVRPERPAPQAEQRQQSGDRGQGFEGRRFDRADNAPRRQVEAPQQAEAPQPRTFDGRSREERRGFEANNREDRRNIEVRRNDQMQQSGERNWNRGRDGGWTRRDGDLRQSDRPVPDVMRDRNALIVSQVPREGTQPPLRTQTRRYSGSNWSTNWRNNRHYDWRNWRDGHRSTFRIGIYLDPFGWRYRPYQIGWRLWPSYYSRNYWINDPWQYRLPYPPPGTTWVRYWDDALLVDIYSGEVIDVIHNFFW